MINPDDLYKVIDDLKVMNLNDEITEEHFERIVSVIYLGGQSENA